MKLAPCKVCGAPCKVQTFGRMGPGDYYVDRLDDPPMWPHGPHRNEKTGESLRNYWLIVEHTDPPSTAARISCTSCNRHTKWTNDAALLIAQMEDWQ